MRIAVVALLLGALVLYLKAPTQDQPDGYAGATCEFSEGRGERCGSSDPNSESGDDGGGGAAAVLPVVTCLNGAPLIDGKCDPSPKPAER